MTLTMAPPEKMMLAQCWCLTLLAIFDLPVLKLVIDILLP